MRRPVLHHHGVTHGTDSPPPARTLRTVAGTSPPGQPPVTSRREAGAALTKLPGAFLDLALTVAVAWTWLRRSREPAGRLLRRWRLIPVRQAPRR
ncbi:hypothetical protein Psuf_043190 [Phytohabitans suffuscus]|uniref:Uncharacterized protein n=1 Tax=Phytohabitans suffuscus TaxID=624315 RepID=A0A6F8YLT0_9ACTN|nr:hypothetical protein Psuf_043190 [Phytohabitans suffuscus]